MKNSARVLALGLGWCAACVAAQEPASMPDEIRLKRGVLTQERSAITQAHVQLSQACWQKFAVNDCLSNVRKSKRLNLDPIERQELALNAQERAWRTQQRNERLELKASDLGDAP